MTETLLAVDNTPPTLDPNKNYLTELVGDGKKFKSPEDLAKGKYEADLYIETLKRQQDELRKDYLKLRDDASQRAKLEELIGQLEAKKVQQHTSNEQPPVNDVKMPTLDSKEIESLVSNKIQEYEFTKKQTENFNSVKSKLVEQFGENYQNVLQSQIAQLGLSEEDINALARKSPAAFFRTLGLEEAAPRDSFRAPPHSSVRSDSFAPTAKQKRSWSYYQEMKKNDPKRYYDPKTNVQMHNDAIELGEAFKDGDYNAI